VISRLRRVYRGNVILTGMRSGSWMRSQGKGFADFSSAIALANSLASARLETYQAAHRRLSRATYVMRPPTCLAWAI